MYFISTKLVSIKMHVWGNLAITVFSTAHGGMFISRGVE